MAGEVERICEVHGEPIVDGRNECRTCQAEKLAAKRAVDPLYGRSTAEKERRLVQVHQSLAEAVDLVGYGHRKRPDNYDRGARDHVRRSTDVTGNHRRQMDEQGIPLGEGDEFKPDTAKAAEYTQWAGDMLWRRHLGLETWPLNPVAKLPQEFLDFVAFHGLEVRQ